MRQSTQEETTRLLDEEELEFLSDIAEAEEEDLSYAIPEEDGVDVPVTGRRGLRRVITHASGTERGIMAVVLALIVLVASLGIVLVRVRTVQSAVQSFEEIGGQLEGIGVIGAEGIQTVERLAAKDAAANEQERLDLLRRSAKDTQVPEDERVVVTISLQTVVSDLKIKFLDLANGKIIPGVPFSATVTGPDGNRRMVTDEDKDGIIHLTGIPAGTYDVGWGIIEEEDFRRYVFDNIVRRATVSEQADYKKVDVSDEVIAPAEMPADSVVRGMQGAGIEERPADTVELVESAKVMISGGEEYIEIPRSEVKDPGAVAGARRTLRVERLRHVTGEDGSSATGAAGEDAAPASGESATETGADEQETDAGTADGTQTTNAPAGETESGTGAGGGETAAENGTGTEETTKDSEAEELIEEIEEAETIEENVTEDTGGDTGTGTEALPDETVTEDTSGENRTDTGDGSGTETTAPETETAPDTPLQTLDGQPVYVRTANGLFVAATAADYANAETVFYRKVTSVDGEYQYTGWQTIQGKLYFFDKNHNAVTGEQTIGGVKYTFREDGSLIQSKTDKGIDVSSWNGDIDWNAVRGAGITFAVIRLGYRGSVTSRLTNDTNYHKNMQGAAAAGLRVGVYFVTQAVNETEAVEEASYCLSMVGSYPLSLPVFLDVEQSGGRGDEIDSKTRTAVCRAFCNTIANGGYAAGIYANKDWMTNYIDMTQLTDHTIWMAQYSTEPTYDLTRIDLWQHSSQGKIPGISGDVDLNISYVNW